MLPRANRENATASSSSADADADTVIPNPVPLASDVANPSITVRHIENAWKSHADLDLACNNWVTWHQNVILVLQLSGGLDLYLEGLIPEPDPAIEPRAHINWLINNRAVCALMKTHCSPTELTVIAKCHTALATWTTLKNRHEQQGTVSQIQLMQEAFLIRYSTTKTFADTSEDLRVLNERIWAMGPPTPDNFLVILMVLALSTPDFRGVRDAVITGLASASTTTPYTAANICSHPDLEQRICNADMQAASTTALSFNNALSAHVKLSNRKICSNCKKEGHIIDYCIQPGGKMAGQPLKNTWAAEQQSRPPKLTM